MITILKTTGAWRHKVNTAKTVTMRHKQFQDFAIDTRHHRSRLTFSKRTSVLFLFFTDTVKINKAEIEGSESRVEDSLGEAWCIYSTKMLSWRERDCSALICWLWRLTSVGTQVFYVERHPLRHHVVTTRFLAPTSARGEVAEWEISEKWDKALGDTIYIFSYFLTSLQRPCGVFVIMPGRWEIWL